MKGQKLLVSLVGGLVLMLVLVYVVTPQIQRQLYMFGANTQIKPEQRCEAYKSEYVDMMAKKANMSPLLEKAKQDKCLK